MLSTYTLHTRIIHSRKQIIQQKERKGAIQSNPIQSSNPTRHIRSTFSYSYTLTHSSIDGWLLMTATSSIQNHNLQTRFLFFNLYIYKRITTSQPFLFHLPPQVRLIPQQRILLPTATTVNISVEKEERERKCAGNK